MDQFNLDAMFDNMLGELDIISQQLEESTDTSKSSPKSEENEKRSSGYSQNSSDTSSSQSYSKPPPQVNVTEDIGDDIDLSEMLSDLTDWEHNLTSGQGQMPAMKSASQDSGIGFNGNSLPRNTNLSTQYGMEGSPQFNTLKRVTTSGPTVQFGEEDDLSLASLEKDIDHEKKEQDKSRQLTAEELAALSPVMQELDDLVSDLSNLSFQHDYKLERQASERKRRLNNVAAVAPAPIQEHVFADDTQTIPSVGQNSKVGSVRHTANHTSLDSQYVTRTTSATSHPESVAPYETVAVTPVENARFHPQHAATHMPCHANNRLQSVHGENGIPQKRTITFQQDAVGDSAAPPRCSPQVKWPPENTPQNLHMLNGGLRHEPRHEETVIKPPIPPPVASKPKLPDKPYQNHEPPQRERSFTAPGPKPALPVKRQASVKAPANLSNLLEKRLQRQNSVDGTSPTGPGPVPFPGSLEHRPSMPGHGSLIRQNSAEIRMAPNHSVLARKHSASRTSVKSNVSTTSSLASVKSNSSTESTASETSMHSADEQLSKRYSFAPTEIKRQLDAVIRQADIENLTPEEREERIKAEKMRIALEKLKEARILKLVVKVYNKDDSSKTLVVDERMTTRTVVRQLLEKNHYEDGINWALIEELPSLCMERIFEEHEQVTEMLSYWTRDTTNQVRFVERKDKYALFRNPQHYLLTTSDTEGQMAERQKQTLIEEFFSGRSGTGVPEVQGILYLKGDSKSWTRKYCVLRTSGLYCSKSGEPKKGKKVSDLQCLVMFEQVCVYLGRGFKKKHKSPTDYGFALKHPAIQTKSKHIKYFCCEDVRSLMRWIVGIRCAKYGKQLKENFDKTNDEMKAGNTISVVPFQAQQAGDSTSTVSTDSGEAGSRQGTLPRANLSNVFEGAWQRASQQENAGGGNEGHAAQRAKSVWKPQQAKTNSNWWDLGPQDTEDSSESATISNRTSATSNIGSVISNNRISVSSTGSRDSGTPTFVPPSPTQLSHQGNLAFKPPPPGPPDVAHPPPPMAMMGGMPPPPNKNHFPPPAPYMNKGMPPPPPMKNNPPPPPMKNVGPPRHPFNKPDYSRNHGPPQNPPSFGNKPRYGMGHQMPPPVQSMAPPPPPLEDMPPPPHTNDFMPPPPPMEDLPPPPPMDDDMPLPPPMEVTPNPGLPKGLRSVNGQAPVRLPMLPMFKSGGFPGLRGPAPRGPKPMGGPPPPGPKPGPPPPPKKMSYPPPPPNNYNYNNNKPPLLPREEVAPVNQVRPTVPPFKSRSVHRKPSNPNYQPHNFNQNNQTQQSFQAPLTHYYNSNASSTNHVSYRKDDFPPPPDFVLDLKDTFHQVNHSDPANKNIAAFDLPPPPPELLLSEVMSRRQQAPPPPPKGAKPAPPPPKRSPSTKLSFKRR